MRRAFAVVAVVVGAAALSACMPHGGAPAPNVEAYELCRDFGGTFHDRPDDQTIWACTGGPPGFERFFDLFVACGYDYGGLVTELVNSQENDRCLRPTA